MTMPATGEAVCVSSSIAVRGCGQMTHRLIMTHRAQFNCTALDLAKLQGRNAIVELLTRAAVRDLYRLIQLRSHAHS